MGGVVDGGVGIGIKTSPRRAAIEKAQAELTQEYDVREARKRELEFLEKGGNPLDFKFGNLTLSLQSTSLNDRHLDQYPSSEAKGSFAFAASPLGDSFESSGRPGVPSVHGRNSADNPVHFAGENDMHEVEKNRKNDISSSEQSSQLGRNRNGKETEESTIFRPYARRNRSRSNCDGGRLCSADAVHNRGGVGSSVAARASLRDGNGSSSEANNQKDQNAHTSSKPKILSRNADMVSRTSTPENRLDGKIGGEQNLVSTTSLKRGCMPIDKFEATTKGSKDNQHKQSFGNRKSSTDAVRTAEDIVRGEEGVVAGGADDLPSISRERDDDVSGELNGSSDVKGDIKNMTVKIQNASEAIDRKVLESATCPGIGLDVENDAALDSAANVSSSGITVEQLSEPENQKLVGSETVEELNVTKLVESNIIYRKENDPAHLNHGAAAEVEEETNASCSLEAKGDSACIVNEVEQKQQKEKDAGDTIKDGRQILHNHPNLNKETSFSRPAVDVSSREAPTTSLSGMKSASLPYHQSLCDNPNSVDKAYEDSVLEEARIIEAKHKRIAEFSFRSLAVESRQRCQWDFVLEEMTWLANDFAQERLWKTTAAAQLCHRITSVSRLRLKGQSRQRKLRSVAHSLSQAVMQFWRSAEALLNSDDTHSGLKDNQLESMGSQRKSNVKVSEENTGDYNMDSCKKLLLQSPGESTRFSIQGYASRFLRDSKSHVYPLKAETPKTPDTVSHMDIMEISWDDELTEESLFYMVPPGAMEIYRKFIESYITECERTGSNVKGEVGMSVVSTVADQIYQEIAYDEDEAETSTLYLPLAFKGRNSSKFAMEKRKNRTGLYDQAADLPYGQHALGTHPSMEKKPANLNVGPNPPKRMRTASRQRVLSPFGPGANAGLPGQPKNDTSSGETNSFHDDQYILYGGSRAQRSMEVESAAEFEKDLPYEFTETSTKPKKKKKKKKDSTFERGWHLGSAALCEQREHSKKRLEHFESNGTSGLYGQHNAKKPKMTKQSLDNSYYNIVVMTGSIPGPVTSQMSNMSNQNKVMKFIGGRDRSRKVKAPKASSLQSGPGSSWSLFEDQVLVVLVHDMGPNWELVSDAINSTLQFKCIFRKSKECKERHKLLMDKTAGDVADSAEDSGTSQPYPFTLPGIPKGSARQLFQRLQSPVEEDALKEHFDKIIQIVQRQHHRRIQVKNESPDPKQIAVHNSHFIALSQVCPNSLSGVFLTPLDLIEATPSNPDALPLNHQGSHAGMGMSTQGAVSSMPRTVSNSLLPGSSGAVAGTNMVSPSGLFKTPVRDGRYTVPKTPPSPGDVQQRLQYNPPPSNRKIPQSNLSMFGTLSGSDRGVHMSPGGNGLGMASGMTRTLPVSRLDFQVMGPSLMLNSSSMKGTPNPVNTHSGSGPTQANSMLRPREPSHMVRGGQSTEQPRQMSVPERQMHVNHKKAQGVPPFNGLGSAFSPGQTYPGLPQQQHQMSPQPANAPNSRQLTGTNHPPGYLKHAKEQNLQQRSMQQQQFAAPSNLMPHVQPQPQPQIPVSIPLQNNAPIQPHPLPPSLPLSPLTPSSPMAQNQQKNQLPPHGLARNTTSSVGGLTNQIGKQRQFKKPRRNHPQQNQQAQPQQHQGKSLKGVNRGSMLLHQKLPVISSRLNGLSGVGTKSVQSSKPQSSQNSQMQQLLPSGPANPQSQPPSLTENTTQGQFPPVTFGNASLAPHQAVLMASGQQLRQQNQVARTQQILPQSRQQPIKSTSEKVQGDQKFMPPTTSVDSSNKVTAVASGISMQNKAPEAVHDPGLPSTSGQGASIGCLTLPSSMRTEALPSVSQGLGHISLQQQPPSLQTQQQTAVQGNTYVGSANS